MSNTLLSGNIQEKIQWYIRAHGHSSIGGLNLMWTYFTYNQQTKLADICEHTIDEFENFDQFDDPDKKIDDIKANVDLIRESINTVSLESEKRDELQQMIRGIYENIDRIETIISNPGYEEEFYLENILDSTFTGLLKRYPQTLYGDRIGKRQHDESIRIHFSSTGSSRKLVVCGYEMQLLFYNLISNAIEAIQQHRTGDGSIVISFEYRKDTVIIRIANSGVPISKEILKKLESKQSVSTKGKHHGKGLQIVYDIVEKYNAVVGVTVEDGQTIFSIVFPYSR